MARFFKGVGAGTVLHARDLRSTGIAPHQPGSHYDEYTAMNHVARANTTSPCISVTRSFGVARDYAWNACRIRPTKTRPSYVYEIDLSEPLPLGLRVVDPTCEVSKRIDNPLASPSYHHDGAQTFLLGVVDPSSMKSH